MRYIELLLQQIELQAVVLCTTFIRMNRIMAGQMVQLHDMWRVMAQKQEHVYKKNVS